METTKKVEMKADNNERFRNDTWGNPVKERMNDACQRSLCCRAGSLASVYRINGYQNDTSVIRESEALNLIDV